MQKPNNEVLIVSNYFVLVCCLIQLQTSISINYNLDFNRHIQSKSDYSLKVLIATEEAIKHV